MKTSVSIACTDSIKLRSKEDNALDETHALLLFAADVLHSHTRRGWAQQRGMLTTRRCLQTLVRARTRPPTLRLCPRCGRRTRRSPTRRHCDTGWTHRCLRHPPSLGMQEHLDHSHHHRHCHCHESESQKRHSQRARCQQLRRHHHGRRRRWYLCRRRHWQSPQWLRHRRESGCSCVARVQHASARTWMYRVRMCTKFMRKSERKKYKKSRDKKEVAVE